MTWLEIPASKLLSRFANPAHRKAAAVDLAAQVGADSFLIFLKDSETGSFRPAPGFEQSLPGGKLWRNFLQQAARLEEASAPVHFPNAETEVSALSKSCGDAIIVFVGKKLRDEIKWEGIEDGLPLLIALLKTEAEILLSKAREAAATDSALHASHLAQALEKARKESSSASLKLRELNLTLEQRVTEEITRRTEAEAAFRQAQKLEAIGQLTGGVAHDFNNLLTVILGGLETIGRQIEGSPETLQISRIVRAQTMALQASHRAATLTARLLAFSRRQPLDPKPIDADRLIKSMGDLLQSTLGEPIRLQIVSSAGLWKAHVDASELEHAILNLVVNARDAMPDGGRLTIETGNTWLDDTYVAALAEPVPAGQYVLIAITDTGVGMDAATSERAFEPFFTTKSVGKGTGLGLSQVYGFVRQTGGHVRIYSEPKHGTTIKLYLPRDLATPDDAQGSKAPPGSTLLRGEETILVVEDHADLRAYASGVLRDLGYKILEAADAASAISILSSDIQIDLLFTDVVLPDGVHGKKIAEHAKEMRPGIKILFTTGYTRNAIVHNGRLDPGVNLLNKPFTFDGLAVKVRKVLDERQVDDN